MSRRAASQGELYSVVSARALRRRTRLADPPVLHPAPQPNIVLLASAIRGTDVRSSHLIWIAGFLYAAIFAIVITVAALLFYAAVFGWAIETTDVEPDIVPFGVAAAAFLVWLFFSMPGLLLIVFAETEQACHDTKHNTAQVAASCRQVAQSFTALTNDVQAARSTLEHMSAHLDRITSRVP